MHFWHMMRNVDDKLLRHHKMSKSCYEVGWWHLISYTPQIRARTSTVNSIDYRKSDYWTLLTHIVSIWLTHTSIYGNYIHFQSLGCLNHAGCVFFCRLIVDLLLITSANMVTIHFVFLSVLIWLHHIRDKKPTMYASKIEETICFVWVRTCKS